jgi:5,10-methylenetetrahydromethanopterin reductase
MNNNMRISCSLGSMLKIQEIFECSRLLNNTKIETIWVPETWGMENFSVLSGISAINYNQKLGSSIINIFSRSPASIAMGAVSIDIISNGRMVLGLGTSSVPIVESFHGYKFEKPLQRMREYVEIIRLIASGKSINYSGKIFNLKNFQLLVKPLRKSIPIYIAAINQKMTELTWEIGDGVIFYLRPKQEMKETIRKMQLKRKIDVTCQIITAISNDSDKAINRAKKTLAFYVSVGKIYRDFIAENGFRSEVDEIFNEYKKSGLNNVHQYVSDSMLKELTIAGTPEECKKQLIDFQRLGIDLPIIQFNPVEQTIESMKLLQKTFFEE